MTDNKPDKSSCPFCGSTNLGTESMYDEDRDPCEFDATVFNDCLGSAPADVWDRRAGEAMNSGDEV